MIERWVAKYIGLSFEEYNCWQLMCHIYGNHFGIALPTFDGEYRDAMDGEQIRAIYERELETNFVKVPSPKKYDFVVIRMDGQPWHCGLVVDKGWMLHTEIGINSVVEGYGSLQWKERIIGFYRHQGRRQR